MADPSPPPDPLDPLAPARGLGLDGLLELAVARSALAAGVSPMVVLEELQREVERRLVRTYRYYDEAGW